MLTGGARGLGLAIAEELNEHVEKRSALGDAMERESPPREVITSA